MAKTRLTDFETKYTNSQNALMVAESELTVEKDKASAAERKLSQLEQEFKRIREALTEAESKKRYYFHLHESVSYI